jgi:AraC-like DNA-binding protein
VISDVMMPGMDGVELVRRIRQNININHIPVVLLTSMASTESRVEGLDSGADAYITKPFNTEVLRSTVMSLVENRERLRGSFAGRQVVEEMTRRIELKSVDEQLMERVMGFINENISNSDLSVEILASQVGMSRVHLHRRLKNLTGQSAGDFIKAVRLRQAASLLGQGKFTVSEVAYATGFSNLSHFSNSFKEFYGMSPTAYVHKPS